MAERFGSGGTYRVYAWSSGGYAGQVRATWELEEKEEEEEPQREDAEPQHEAQEAQEEEEDSLVRLLHS